MQGMNLGNIMGIYQLKTGITWDHETQHMKILCFYSKQRFKIIYFLKSPWDQWAIIVMSPRAKLPACTTATAHTLAFEFDLVMDPMAIFSNKQTEVSTGEKTYDMTVYEIWKHAAWSKHAAKSWLYVEHPVG